MKKLFLTHRTQLLILFLVPFIISLSLVKNNFVFGGAEEGIPFFNVSQTIKVYSNIWVDQVPGYPLVFEVGKISFLLVLVLLSFISSSGTFISTAFVFSLMSIGIFGMYVLALSLLQKSGSEKQIALWVSLFYVLNPFSMAQIWGRHLSMQMYPFGLIPLFLALFVIGLRARIFSYAVCSILLSVVLAGSFNHPSYVISTFFLLFFYFVIYGIVNKEERFYALGYAVRSGVLFLFAHSFWILPYLAQAREPNDFIGNADNLSILMGLSQYFPLSTILTLKQKYYFNIVQAFGPSYVTPLFAAIALLLPLTVFIGMAKRASLKKEVRAFVLFGFFIALFISAGGNRPFGPIVLWFINTFPILEIYRNAYEKFGLFFTIFYSVFFGIGFHQITKFLTRRHLSAIAALLVITIFGVYVHPMWNGSVFQERDATNEPPHYYRDFITWAQENSNAGRVLLTPIIPGDATTQQWGEKQYRGIDVSPFVIPEGTITREIPGLPGNEFTRTLRNQMQQQDVSEVLTALRVKYIVNRGDAIVNPALAKHIEYLTSQTYKPTTQKSVACKVPSNTALQTNLFYDCKVSNNDLSGIKFINVAFTTNTKVALEVRLLDKNGLRTRWDGRQEERYLVDESSREIVLPIGIETELPEKFSYKDVVAVEISYFELPEYKNAKVTLQGVTLDPGVSVSLTNFQKIESFGKLDVYQNKKDVFNEIRSPQKIVISPTMQKFFETYTADENSAYVVFPTGKNSSDWKDVSNSLKDTKKISQTNYRVDLTSEKAGYIWLGKSMNSGWKVISGTPSSDIEILRSATISENNHLTADGYANLWKVEGSRTYTIVYMPAVFVTIGIKISIITFILMILFLVIAVGKNRRNMNQ